MNHLLKYVETHFSRRRFLGALIAGSISFIFGRVRLANAEYKPVKKFLIRSIEDTPIVDLTKWQLRIEGLVENPLVLRFDELRALPKKAQTKAFICVEGWGLDNPHWEGIHLSQLFSRVKISPKAYFVSFYAAGGKYRDSLSIQEALEPDTLLAYAVNGRDLEPANGFPLRLVMPRMFAYKSVKWVERVVFTEKQEMGFWENSGYPPDASIPGLKS